MSKIGTGESGFHKRILFGFEILFHYKVLYFLYTNYFSIVCLIKFFTSYILTFSLMCVLLNSENSSISQLCFLSVIYLRFIITLVKGMFDLQIDKKKEKQKNVFNE
jgi:hypothetical protein